MRTGIVLGIVVAALAFSAPAHADAITWDFESEAATWLDDSRDGDLTSLSMTVAGVTITIYRTSEAAFDIVSNSNATGGQTGKPSGWGDRSLDPFFSLPEGDKFVANFSQDMYDFSIQFGDYWDDADTPVTLELWTGLDGTGTLVGTVSKTWTADQGFPDFETLFVSGKFQSAVFWGSGPYSNSLFYDNIQANPTPEPATLVLFGAAGAAMLARRARKRRSSAA